MHIQTCPTCGGRTRGSDRLERILRLHLRLAAWGVLWAAHVGCGYPAPPAYTALGPLP